VFISVFFVCFVHFCINVHGYFKLLVDRVEFVCATQTVSNSDV